MADTTAPQPRRSKRTSEAISPSKPTNTTTPSRQRANKKARFSEPIPSLATTGLTPAIGKAALKTPRRRVSTPAITRFQDHDEIQFTPFRQQLSARTQRQIRRIGLSETQNDFEADKKSQAQLQRQLEQKSKELQILKDELEASKLREASLLQRSEVASSQQRIGELEAEVESLAQSFNQETAEYRGEPLDFDDAGGFQIYEDSSVDNENQPVNDEDDATVDLECENARQEKEAMFRASQSFSNSFVHFEDSPVRPAASRDVPSAPELSTEALSKEFNAAINRAEEAEVALAAMASEIKSLGFQSDNSDASECLSAIKSHFHSMRLDLERIVPGETSISFQPARLMPEMLIKLRLVSSQIRDREAELRSMHEQQRSLKGNFDHALLASERANSRIKELEDTLDKNAEEMLDQRMRAQALERESAEHQQNNRALITAIEKYRQEVHRLEELVTLIEAEHTVRLQDIRTATTAQFTQQISDMDAKVAAETHGRRAAEDSAVERLRKINELETALTSARQRSSGVEEQLQSLESQLSTSNASHEQDLIRLNTRISTLERDNNKLETLVRSEVARSAEYADQQHRILIDAVVKSANDKKAFVRGSKVRLANWELESEMRDELSSDPVGAPMTPSSIVRFSEFSEVEDDDNNQSPRDEDSSSAVEDCEDDDGDEDHIEGRVELSRGRHRRRSSVSLPASSPFLGRGILKKMKPRRRYDSGIGMDSLDEGESGDGAMTPELSSEIDTHDRFGADVDVDVDHDVMV